MSGPYRPEFFGIIISPAHWRDELVYARETEAAAMALFPNLYRFSVDKIGKMKLKMVGPWLKSLLGNPFKS